MAGSGGVVRRLMGRLAARRTPPGPAAYPPPPVEVASMLTRVWWEDEHTLALAGWAYVPGVSVTADDRPSLGLRLEGRQRTVEAEAAVSSLVDPAVDEAADDPEETYAAAAFEAELDLRAVPGLRTGPWTVVVSLDTEHGPVTVPFAERDVHGSAGLLVDSAPRDGRVVRPEWVADNGLVLDLAPAEPAVPSPRDVVATWLEADPDAGTLSVTATAASGDLTLELRSPHRSVRAEVSWRDGRLAATLPLLAPDWYGEDRALPSGTWFLRAVRPDGSSSAVGLGASALPTVGEVREGALLHARVERTVRDTVRLRLDPPLRPDERGTFAQRQLRRAYHAMPPVTRRDRVFHECYYGVACTDSARAIHDELARRGGVSQVWGVRDRSVPVPQGSTAVLRLSREWWQALGSSAYLTFNAGLPAGLVRRPGQVLVQTWHGTPLKLLGHDRPVNHGKEGFAESTGRYVSRWDHLLAGNPHSAEVFRRAWFYDGSVLELGYPRNDALAVPDPATAAATRRRLGLPDGAPVVLYAPTWRDGERTMPDLLDLDRLGELLGPDVAVLVRGHMNIARWQQRPDAPGALDVTDYPEVDDLLLLADVLVTDYSSVMFDYSVTRKPMIFFVPDLQDYRDRRRGLYFDLAGCAPGPVLTTTEEVAEAVRRLDRAAYEQEFGERYDAWVARFNPLDDGHAAARVVDAVYELD